jgi:PhnB protein
MPSRSPKKSPPRKTTKATRAGKAPKAQKAPGKRPAARNAVKSAREPPVFPPKIQYRNVTPMLVAANASNAIAWYKKAFGATELSRDTTPDGKIMHAAIQIGDSKLMLADAFQGPVPTQMTGVTLHIQSPDIQAHWDRAIAGGATVTMPLANQFWGDKYGQLRDPFGHNWSLGWPAKMTEAEKTRLQVEATKMFATGQTN